MSDGAITKVFAVRLMKTGMAAPPVASTDTRLVA